MHRWDSAAAGETAHRSPHTGRSLQKCENASEIVYEAVSYGLAAVPGAGAATVILVEPI